MGAAFSSNQLAGASRSPAPVLPTSYAFYSGNTRSFGFTATFSADPSQIGTATAVTSPVLTLPLKAGGSTVVACGPAAIPADPTGTSITCPIANTLIGAGTATFAFTATGAANTENVYYLIAFTTGSPKKTTVTVSTATTKTVTPTVTTTLTGSSTPATVTWCPTATTGGWTGQGSSAIPKQCRLINKHDNTHDLPRRAAGYGPPDITYTGPIQPKTTTATEIFTVTATNTKTVTVDGRNPTTITVCPTVATTPATVGTVTY